VYDTSDQACKGGPLPSGTSATKTTWSTAAEAFAQIKAASNIASSLDDIELLDLDPCGASFSNLMVYFNTPDVMAALHAPTHRADGVTGWGICTDFAGTQGNYSYQKTIPVTPYGSLLSDIDISIYSGDTDAVSRVCFSMPLSNHQPGNTLHKPTFCSVSLP